MNNTSEPFINAIIGTEILSLIMNLIIIAGSKIGYHSRSKRTRLFILFVFTGSVGCFCDLISWILDGRADMQSVLYPMTFGSMIIAIVLTGIFISYFTAYISEKKPISYKPVRLSYLFVAAAVAVTTVLGFTGNLFTFENGVFTEKPLYPVYVIVTLGYVVIGTFIIMRYRSLMDRYDQLAAYTYMLIPVSSALIGFFVDGWDFTYPAITVSSLILYVLLQSDRTKELEIEGNLSSYQATHDELTGLYNRTAYQSHIRAMQSKKENSGVIFGDLNGLKYTNDNFGHEAGDQLLIRYAGILTGIFSMNEIYRVSGDEFICVMENCPEEEFGRRVSKLESTLNQETPPLACVGAAFGPNMEIEVLVRNAENSMYAKKKIVHEQFPKTRR